MDQPKIRPEKIALMIKTINREQITATKKVDQTRKQNVPDQKMIFIGYNAAIAA